MLWPLIQRTGQKHHSSSSSGQPPKRRAIQPLSTGDHVYMYMRCSQPGFSDIVQDWYNLAHVRATTASAQLLMFGSVYTYIDTA